MRSIILTVSWIIFLYSCAGSPDRVPAAGTRGIYPTTGYLAIKLGPGGSLPENPYVLTFEHGEKKILFCGVNHLTNQNDTGNALFTRIEQAFAAFKPDIAVNEGGDISKKKYASRTDALLQDMEIGLTRVLCDSAKITTVDGDPGAAYEFAAILKKYPRGAFLAYMVTERLMWSLKGRHIADTLETIKNYDAFIRQYIITEGRVPLAPAEQSFGFYKAQYAKLLHRPFRLEDLEPTNPFEPVGQFQEIGRYSKEVRDQYLLQTIDSLLDRHNKVFVVFGGWHLLTCKSGLVYIVKRRRN